MDTELSTFMPGAIFRISMRVFYQIFLLQLPDPPFIFIPSQIFAQEGPNLLRTMFLSLLLSPLLPLSSLRLFDTNIIDRLVNIVTDEIRGIFHIDEHAVTSSESQIPEIPLRIVINVTHNSIHATTQYLLRTVSSIKKPIDMLKKSTVLQIECCCCICLDEFELNAECYALLCQHFFHQECIMRWLQTNQTCPICRQSLRTVKD
ncbi:hypothetical protein V8G54_032679 [Vigna mungo]|uniref:RING-type E3 ubiquitin transferase n=1 Tax=Vigna mungo TaxID=3915 RepID=A0AAQ3MMF5_VIGMU